MTLARRINICSMSSPSESCTRQADVQEFSLLLRVSVVNFLQQLPIAIPGLVVSPFT